MQHFKFVLSNGNNWESFFEKIILIKQALKHQDKKNRKKIKKYLEIKNKVVILQSQM